MGGGGGGNKDFWPEYLPLYIGNGKGVATALNKVILEYPIQLIQSKCKVMWMLSMKVLQFVQDPIEYFFNS